MVPFRFSVVLPALPLFLSATSIQAQQRPDAGRLLEQVRPAPSLPQEKAPGIQLEEARPPRAADSTRIHVSRLKIIGATRFTQAELHTVVAEREGKELTLDDLNALGERITGLYRDHGYLLARAYLPAQDVKDGVVEIAVLEGFLGQVTTDNTAAVGGQALAPLENLQPGQVAQGHALERNLLLLSDLPGVEVKSTLKPGATLGATDLLVDVAPGRRLAGSVELDNFGDRFSGQHRLGGSLQFNNPLYLGDQATLRALVSDEGLRYLRAGCQLPLNRWGTRVGIAASDLHYELGKNLKPLGAEGDSRVQSLYLQHPLIRSRRMNLNAQLQYDHLGLEDRIRSTATDVERKLDNWSAGLSGDFLDDLGRGAINSFSVAYTTGEVKLDPTTEALDAATARTAGRYEKWNASWLRLQRITDSASLYVSASVQAAEKNLDSSQKLSLGGANGVRAYPQGEAPGDEVYLVAVEARHQVNPPWPGQWQLLAFVDHGGVRINKHPWTATDNERHLTGAGLGFQGGPGSAWAVKASLAWRIDSEKPLSDRDRVPRGWIQAVKYF